MHPVLVHRFRERKAVVKSLCLIVFCLIGLSLLSCGPGMNDEPPLHDAAMRGDVKKVKTLIKSGVSVHSTNIKGATPLHWAAFKGHTDVAKVLLRYGADIDAATKKGTTPLALAKTHKRDEMISFLKARGARDD